MSYTPVLFLGRRGRARFIHAATENICAIWDGQITYPSLTFD